MRKGVIHHDHIELPLERLRLHIAADHAHLLRSIFGGRDLRHLGRDVDAGDRGHVAAQIVREKHAGAAGHVQHVHPDGHTAVVQNGADYVLVSDHLRVPEGRAAVKEPDYIVFIDHGFASCFG